jgi:hypothetical protein
LRRAIALLKAALSAEELGENLANHKAPLVAYATNLGIAEPDTLDRRAPCQFFRAGLEAGKLRARVP